MVGAQKEKERRPADEVILGIESKGLSEERVAVEEFCGISKSQR